jgi:hypothetical protein
MSLVLFPESHIEVTIAVKALAISVPQILLPLAFELVIGHLFLI